MWGPGARGPKSRPMASLNLGGYASGTCGIPAVAPQIKLLVPALPGRLDP